MGKYCLFLVLCGFIFSQNARADNEGRILDHLHSAINLSSIENAYRNVCAPVQSQTDSKIDCYSKSLMVNQLDSTTSAKLVWALKDEFWGKTKLNIVQTDAVSIQTQVDDFLKNTKMASAPEVKKFSKQLTKELVKLSAQGGIILVEGINYTFVSHNRVLSIIAKDPRYGIAEVINLVLEETEQPDHP